MHSAMMRDLGSPSTLKTALPLERASRAYTTNRPAREWDHSTLNGKKMFSHLSELLEHSALIWPNRPAVESEQGHSQTFAELAFAADRLAARLSRYGIGRGDRVGLFLPKGIEAVSALHGILRSGAAYVPVDPNAPVSRGAGILSDAFVRAVVIDAKLAPEFRDAWQGPGPLPRLILVGEPASLGFRPGESSWNEVLTDDTPSPVRPAIDPDDTAYPLYTSGSTGKPKGVVLSHANAFCFLDWCAETFGQAPGQRFASHAPFHFDLSVFDLYASCRAGATLVLIGEALGKDPTRLADFLATRSVDVWYSAPSILALLAEHGQFDRPGFQAPRLVLFAGEVFPVRPLRQLRCLWPKAELWNLYGPTETNVCTGFRIPETIPENQIEPYPIGSVCSPLRARVVDEHGSDVPKGIEGELLIAGPGVMRGYFGRPDLTELAFQIDNNGTPWYRTGDLVVEDSQSCEQSFIFRGRRDRMVKKRGYRIELGEIEAALYQLDDVARAAVLARSDENGVTISAFVALKPGVKGSIIALKRHCASLLPAYMIPDRIKFLDALPATSTDKVDYQRLATMLT